MGRSKPRMLPAGSPATQEGFIAPVLTPPEGALLLFNPWTPTSPGSPASRAPAPPRSHGRARAARGGPRDQAGAPGGTARLPEDVGTDAVHRSGLPLPPGPTRRDDLVHRPRRRGVSFGLHLPAARRTLCFESRLPDGEEPLYPVDGYRGWGTPGQLLDLVERVRERGRIAWDADDAERPRSAVRCRRLAAGSGGGRAFAAVLARSVRRPGSRARSSVPVRSGRRTCCPSTPGGSPP